MKRLIWLILLCLTLLPMTAQAVPKPSYIDGDPLPLPVEVLDSPYPANEWFGMAPVAVRMTAPNGQALYFASQFLQPVAHAADVNFDGVDDLVVTVDPGGTNIIYRLFIRRDGRYVPVDDGHEKGLYNPQLYPRQGLVASHAVSGEAGALHEEVLLRWEGHRLIPVRRAVCHYRQEGYSQEDVYTQTTWYNVLHARVYAIGAPGYGDQLLWEETYDMQANGMDAAYDAFYRREQNALWQGLEGK
jgi:hypothetical protein